MATPDPGLLTASCTCAPPASNCGPVWVLPDGTPVNLVALAVAGAPLPAVMMLQQCLTVATFVNPPTPDPL